MQSIVYTVEFQKCWLEANLWLNDCRCNTIINVLSELCHCSNYFCCYKVLGLIAMATEESSGLICPQCLIRFDPEFNIQQQTECIDLNLTRVEYFPQNLASIVKYFSLLGRYSNTHFSGRDDGHILGARKAMLCQKPVGVFSWVEGGYARHQTGSAKQQQLGEADKQTDTLQSEFFPAKLVIIELSVEET